MILPKVQIKKILYATDLSESARYAFAYAVSLANFYGAGLTILHVLFEVPNIDSMASLYIGEEEWEKIKTRNLQEAREALIGKKKDRAAVREVLNTFFENVKAQSEGKPFDADEIIVERGDPADQILKHAEEKNCDLIVIGSRGHGALAEAVMGGTAHRVLRRSKKPVLVVRLSDE